MESTASEMMRNCVNGQKFSSTGEIMEAMKDLFRDALRQVMEGDPEEQLGCEKSGRLSESEENALLKNYRNGHSKKSVKTQLGKVDVKIPRDRNGEYEPKIIAKYDRGADGMEEKILGLYACGMSRRGIAEQIKSLYDVETSPEPVNKISEKIMPEVTAWHTSPRASIHSATDA